MGPGENITIECDNNIGHTGQFAAIYFGHEGSLTVCEFEVYVGRFPGGLTMNNFPTFGILELWQVDLNPLVYLNTLCKQTHGILHRLVYNSLSGFYRKVPLCFHNSRSSQLFISN